MLACIAITVDSLEIYRDTTPFMYRRQTSGV